LCVLVYLWSTFCIVGTNLYRKPKLTKGWSLTETGVTVEDDIPTNAKIMLASSVTYFIIQVPAFIALSDTPDQAAKFEAPFALAGLIVSVLVLVAYCAYQVINVQNQEKKIEAAKEKALRTKIIDDHFFGALRSMLGRESLVPGGKASDPEEQAKAVFKRFDYDGDGNISFSEMKNAFRKLNYDVTESQITVIMEELDVDRNGSINFSEFKSAMILLQNRASASTPLLTEANVPLNDVVDDGDNSDEDDEHKGLSPAQVKLRAYGYLFAGAALVTLFADPMVEVITQMAGLLNLNPFYVSFCV
jgi:hypothetical protein